MNWETFQRTVSLMLSRFSSLEFRFFEDRIEYLIDGTLYVYTLEEFNVISSKLSEYTISPTSISSPHGIEVFVEPHEPRYGYRFLDDEVNISDNSISYKVGAPSTELLLAFLSSIPENEIKNYRRMLPTSMMSARYFKSENDTINLFDMIMRVTKVTLSLRIQSVDAISNTTLHKYVKSLLFNVAYNMDTPFKVISSLSELETRKGRPMPRRHARANELEVPKLFYTPELTEQYNLALASEDSFVKFIAYYHIMEYFFDDVYSGELIKSVREVLLHPGFSTKNPKEINKIIDVVRRKTRATKDEFQGTELEALELTIKAFVPLEQLRNDLIDYNPSIVEYYRLHEISFSNGDTIDLNDFGNEKLPKKIAARIYKTRNALVHHKSNNARVKERGVYHPFNDDDELAQEMPLMRLIAEAIIIRSAEEI